MLSLGGAHVRPGYFFFECDTAQSTVTKKSKKGDCLRQSKNRPGSWPKTLSLTTTATAYTHFDPAIEQPGYAKTSEILEDKSQNQRGRPMMLSPRDILPLLCLIAGLLFACNGTKLSLSSAYLAQTHPGIFTVEIQRTGNSLPG